MRTTLRLVVFLPLALVASVFAGGAANTMGEFFGGSTWYGWLLSGAASAWAFFYVAFRVAPLPSRAVKWICVAIVGTIGLLSALGPLLVGRNRVASLAGLVMLVIAIYYARRPVSSVAEEAVMPFV